MMFKKSSVLVRLIVGLSCAFTLSAFASSSRVFDAPGRDFVRPPLWVKANEVLKPNTTGGAGAPYTPAQIRSAYGLSKVAATGTNQTIAIVDAYDDSQYIQSDLNAFCSLFGLPAATVKIIYAAGTKPVADAGWQQEESLDVQWCHAIAPAAKLLLVEAAGASQSQLLQAVQAAVANGATVVSMSWGGGEFPGESSYDSYFAAKGVTYVASAGDSGAGVEWPAASPNVLAVGGTTLILDSTGNWASESAWTDGGGGVSAYETVQPSWQSGWFQSAWTPLHRGVPDVSLIANPEYGVYVCYQGSWYEFGGTSVGAPQWSGIIALANQSRGSNFSGANAVLYAAAKASGKTGYGGYAVNPNYFHDIASGDDGSAPTDYAFTGYDLVTGVGSPIVSNLLTTLGTATQAPPPPTFALAFSPGSETVTVGSAAGYTVTLTPANSYSGTAKLTVSGLPAGATAGFSSNSITRSGSAVLAITTSASTPSGTYTITVTGTDTTGGITKTATATLTVQAALMTVSSASYWASGSKNTTLNITMTVLKSTGAAVSNAAVSATIYYNGSSLASGTSDTAGNGVVTFSLGNARAGYYSAVVRTVTATGLTWNGKYPEESVYDPY